MNKKYLVRHLNYIRKNIVNLFLPVGLTYISSLHLSPFPLPPLFSFLSVSLFTVRPLITDTQIGQKKNNIQVHSATSYLIFQYLQYWYNQYFPESSSICNIGITSISQNLPVSAILMFWQWPVSSSIADTGKFWKILGY